MARRRHATWTRPDRTPLREVGTDPDARMSLANERTFLAWIRTALSLIVAGVAVVQLLPPFSVPGGTRIIGVSLIAIGAAIGFGSYRSWLGNERALRLGTALPDRMHVTRLVAYSITLVAVVAAAFALLAGDR